MSYCLLYTHKSSRYAVNAMIDQNMYIVMNAYRISSNKHPGAYFLQGLQDQAFKRDWAFIRVPALILDRSSLISKARWTYVVL